MDAKSERAEKKRIWQKDCNASFSNIGNFVIFFGLPFILYLMTLSPGISEGDSPELIGVSHSLGIAHVGYPLFALLGKTFSVLLPLGSIAYRVNLLSASCGALSLWLLSLLAGRLFPDLGRLILVLLFGTLYLWEQAVIAEVYTLNVLVSTLFISSFLFFDKQMNLRMYGTSFFLLGLSFSSHHSAIFLLVPFLVYRGGDYLRRDGSLLRRLLWGMFFFVTGTSVFLYVPIRAGQQVLWNWNYADNFHGFFELMTGNSFRETVTFSLDWGELLLRLHDYFFYLVSGPAFFWGPLFIMGFFILYRHQKQFCYFYLSLALVELIYCLFINVAPLDVTPFGLLTLLFSLLFVSAALQAVRDMSERFLHQKAELLYTIILLVILGINGKSEFLEVSRFSDTIAADFAWNIEASVSLADVVVCERDEIFPLFYRQTVEHGFSNNELLHVLLFPRPPQWYARHLQDLYGKSFFFNKFDFTHSRTWQEALFHASRTESCPIVTTFYDISRPPLVVELQAQGFLYRLHGSEFSNEFQHVFLWSHYRFPESIHYRPSLLLEKFVAILLWKARKMFFLSPVEAEKFWLQALELDPKNETVLYELMQLAQHVNQESKVKFFRQKLLHYFPEKLYYQQFPPGQPIKTLDR